MQPNNELQTILRLHGINDNLYWKMKFLNQSTYIR